MKTRLSARILAAAPLALSVLSLTTCDLFTYKRPFPDAYYENNFIADIGFDNFVGDQGTASLVLDPLTNLPVPVTGSWDFAYRYDAGWDGQAYMTRADTLTTVSDYGTVPSGLASDAPVFRLELENLIAGGDFESGAGTWNTDGGSTTLITALPAGSSGALSGASVSISVQSTLGYAEFPLASTLAAGFSIIPDASYAVFFSSNGHDMFGKVVPSGEELSSSTSFLIDFANSSSDSFTGSQSGSDVLRLQANGAETSLVLDDLAVRLNASSMVLRLLLTRFDTSPVLESLLYKFTFWIREDDQYGAGANLNAAPYRLDTLKADMLPVIGVDKENPNSTLTKSVEPNSYDYDPASVGWKKMTVYVDNGNLSFKDGLLPSDPVLELVIDLGAARPGRILIAQPELRAYPDGY